MKPSKRQAEDNFWDCSVCTYKNTAEAFKCLMCYVRKGTSTRKPRLNPAIAAQQATGAPASAGPSTAPPAPNANSKRGPDGRPRSSSRSRSVKKRRSQYPPRLKNVDRNSAQTREVTVNNVTVVITEYKPKKPSNSQSPSGNSSSSDVESGDGKFGQLKGAFDELSVVSRD